MLSLDKISSLGQKLAGFQPTESLFFQSIIMSSQDFYFH